MKYDFEIKGEVTEKSLSDVAYAISQIDLENTKSVKAVINSEGGSVFYGLKIYENIITLRNKGIEVRAVIEKQCASIASVIACAFNHVAILENASILTHDIAISGVDLASYPRITAADLNDIAKDLESERGRLVYAYHRKTGKELEFIGEYLKSERVISPVEALAMGLVDEILPLEGSEKFFNSYIKPNIMNLKNLFASLVGEAPKPETKAISVELADGSATVQIPEAETLDDLQEGMQVNVVEEGRTVPAPDGAHALEGGKVVTTEGGRVVSYGDAEAMDKPEEMENGYKEKMEEMENRLIQVSNQLETLAKVASDQADHQNEIITKLEAKLQKQEAALKKIPMNAKEPEKVIEKPAMAAKANGEKPLVDFEKVSKLFTPKQS